MSGIKHFDMLQYIEMSIHCLVFSMFLVGALVHILVLALALFVLLCGHWILFSPQGVPRSAFHAAEAGVAGLEGMESVGPAMAAAAFLFGSSVSFTTISDLPRFDVGSRLYQAVKLQEGTLRLYLSFFLKENQLEYA